MKTLPASELKAQCSEVLEKVKKGEAFGILYGRQKKPVSMLIPYSEAEPKKARKIGVYDGNINIRIADDFEIHEEGFLKTNEA